MSMTVDDREDESIRARFVETYHRDGVWHSRRHDCAEPFASGEGRERIIALGAEVARWNYSRHIIRDRSGAIVEIDLYSAGPYPPRSPIRRIRPET